MLDKGTHPLEWLYKQARGEQYPTVQPRQHNNTMKKCEEWDLRFGREETKIALFSNNRSNHMHKKLNRISDNFLELIRPVAILTKSRNSSILLQQLLPTRKM